LGTNFIDSLLKSEWMGLQNFRFLFQTADALIVFRNTILYNAVFIVLGIVVAVALAIMMSLLRSKKIARVTQTFMFLPHFLSWVVVGYFAFSFLSVERGLFNQILTGFGLPPVQWYMDDSNWPFILIIVNLWKGVGYSMVVYLASIAGIDVSLYEAASIDGATKWEQVKNITIPMLKPIVTIMFIMAVGRIFMSDFGLFYFVPRQQGILFNATATIDVYVYNALMQTNNLGFASAANVTQSIAGFVTIVAANWVVKKLEPENSLF
jgi:putative aldouronate transport system permease protein